MTEKIGNKHIFCNFIRNGDPFLIHSTVNKRNGVLLLCVELHVIKMSLSWDTTKRHYNRLSFLFPCSRGVRIQHRTIDQQTTPSSFLCHLKSTYRFHFPPSVLASHPLPSLTAIPALQIKTMQSHLNFFPHQRIPVPSVLLNKSYLPSLLNL